VRFLGGEKAEPAKEVGYRYGLRPAAPTRRWCRLRRQRATCAAASGRAALAGGGAHAPGGFRLGPVEPFAEFLEHRVTLVNLEALSRRQGLEPLEELLTLVVRPEGELAPVSRALVEQQPELSGLIATFMWKRLPHLPLEEIMTIAGIELAELSETRAYQDILTKGREEGLEKGGQREAAVLVLKQLQRRFGEMTAEQASSIRGLRTAELEELAEVLLEFRSAADLAAWLASRGGNGAEGSC
jgi:hypothetical protein